MAFSYTRYLTLYLMDKRRGQLLCVRLVMLYINGMRATNSFCTCCPTTKISITDVTLGYKMKTRFCIYLFGLRTRFGECGFIPFLGLMRKWCLVGVVSIVRPGQFLRSLCKKCSLNYSLHLISFEKIMCFLCTFEELNTFLLE